MLAYHLFGNGVQRYSNYADRFETNRLLVRTIIVDESLLQIDFQHVKDRTECFDDYFLCRKLEYNRQTLEPVQALSAVYQYGNESELFATNLSAGGG